MTLTKGKEFLAYEQLFENELCPIACSVDEEGYFPEAFMKKLGESGAFHYSNLTESEALIKRLTLTEMASKYCVSTSFLIWCHSTAISFITNSNNSFLKRSLLPSLEKGQLLGGTALSNPMKYYAGMEEIRLKATEAAGGYMINGVTPFVSNIGTGHVFGIIAQVNEDQRILAIVDCNSPAITMKEHKDFAGMNGTGSFTCRFNDLFISNEYIVTHCADEFIPQIRSGFVLSQAGMGFGLIQACIDNMQKVMKKQNGTNQYIDVTPHEILNQLNILQERAYSLANRSIQPEDFSSIVQIRLQTAELALKAAETSMLYQGAAGYYRKSDCMRRLREALFIAVVTPAIKHLKRILHEQEMATSRKV